MVLTNTLVYPPDKTTAILDLYYSEEKYHTNWNNQNDHRIFTVVQTVYLDLVLKLPQITVQTSNYKLVQKLRKGELCSTILIDSEVYGIHYQYISAYTHTYTRACARTHTHTYTYHTYTCVHVSTLWIGPFQTSIFFYFSPFIENRFFSCIIYLVYSLPSLYSSLPSHLNSPPSCLSLEYSSKR